MIDVAVDQYGRLDIAVANAGIIPLASVLEATPDDWDEVMSIDGRGMFLTCKYAIEQMLSTAAAPSSVCPRSRVWPVSHGSRLTVRRSSLPLA
jgi:NAD(P)-dependent dehydrogenase (short-subunit alcohol dehydrogenase family)